MKLFHSSERMSKQVLRAELQTLLQLSHPKISLEAFETTLRSITTSFDWTYFVERAIATNLAGYLLPHPEIAEKYYPDNVLQKIKSYQQRIQLHSSFLREEILQLAPKLQAANIPFALLKGWDLHFRQHISLKKRQISDIDIYIEPSSLNALNQLLQKEGFQTFGVVYKSKWHQKLLPQHAPLHAIKGTIQLDIHTDAFAAVHQIKLQLNFENCVLLDVNGVQIPVLSKKLSGQFLGLHLSKHLEALQQFKGAQIIDLLNEDLSKDGLGPKEKKRMQALESFLERAQTITFNARYPYDAFFFQQLEGTPLPFNLKMRQFAHRIKPKNDIVNSLVLAFFDVFPNKNYLTQLYGNGSYWTLNLKRLKVLRHKR
jgi:hypothetical protein